MQTVANIVGKSEMGAHLIADMKEKLERIKSQTQGRKYRPRVLFYSLDQPSFWRV